MPLLMTTTRLAALLCLCISAVTRAQSAASATADGRKVFATTCAACHQPNAQGLAGQYPPLAGSSWVTGDERRLLRILLHGLTGEVDVEGESFNGAMPGWGGALKDADIAAVASYVRGNFGNHAAAIAPETVARVRQDYAGRQTPWIADELTRDVAAKPAAGLPCIGEKAATAPVPTTRKKKAPPKKGAP
jgi:mono/diheme cytochrome c family protein